MHNNQSHVLIIDSTWTSFIYGQNCCQFFLLICPHEAETWDPSWGWIFWTMIFYNLKNSSQDLSNEGSNFILSSLEVGH